MPTKRREFTDEYKAEVVGLCRAGDRSATQVARDLGLNESTVRGFGRGCLRLAQVRAA
ncbi:MAG: transposase [Candidatus Peribacteraceae bacterium]|nr:transposase [Candidatus Peribacteraceae bacterium]